MPRRILVAPPIGGTPPYRSVAPWREVLRRGLGAALLLATVACAGCSALPQADDDLVTGSIKPRQASLKLPDGDAPKGIAVADWAAAKLALDQALASGEKDISVPWENADTGARGTATPIGATRSGGCRDFMIAVVDGKTDDRWVHGEACRARGETVLSQVRVLGRA